MFLYGFSSCTCLYEWLSISLWFFVMFMFVRMTIVIILVWVFVMHISVRLTIHFFWMDFRHADFCTNDYHFFLNGFSSSTFLYEWLPFLYEWVFVMHISVRMTTISFWMGFRHAHFCTNDYHFFLNGLSSFTFLYEWLPFLFGMDCRHLHSCTNDYHFFLNGFSSFTFLYELLPFLFEWIVVMHVSVRMTTISFWMGFRHADFCTNDYHFFLNGFSSCRFLYEWLPFRCIWVLVMHVSVQMTFNILCVWI